MPGLKLYWVKIRLFISAIFFAAEAMAYVPKIGQVLRFQPQVLRNQKSFKVKGSAVTPTGVKIPYEILWIGQGEYQVTFSQVPRAFFFSDSQKTSSWILRRTMKTPCTLVVEGVSYSCEEPNFWAMIELSAMPDTTTKSFAKSGFIGQSETIYEETDGRALGAIPAFERNGQSQTPTIVTAANITQSQRVQPGLGFNGATPTAVLEVKGDDFVSPNNKIEEGYPLLHFDPTFLAPILARWKLNGQIFTIKAQSDVEVRRKRPRFTHILAGKLEVYEGQNFLGAFERNEPETLTKKPTMPNAEKVMVETSTLRNLLSTEGQNFLSALLLTH